MHLRTLVCTGLLTFFALPSVSLGNATDIGARRRFGLGLVLGYPDVGASINYFLSPGTSLQIDPYLAYQSGISSYSHRGSGAGVFGARVDVLFWPSRLATGSVVELRWFVGPGGRLGLGLGANRGFYLAAELPIGLGLRFQKAPVDLNLELIPVLGLISSGGVNLGLDLALSLNGRYYF